MRRARSLGVLLGFALVVGWNPAGAAIADRPEATAADYGGHAELRFASDRVRGVGNPDWASVTRVGGFAAARFHSRFQTVVAAAYDRDSDALAVERALLAVRLPRNLEAHAGILIPPLGRGNLEHDAPGWEFAERSLVAVELAGAPNAQLGLGLRGQRDRGAGRRLDWELDVVTGYDDGLLTDSPDGTRIARGRNNIGDENGAWALAGRAAWVGEQGGGGALGVLGGAYNTPEVGAVKVDDARYMMVAIADGSTQRAGFGLSAEAGAVWVDVPPGLEGLFAERQWGASLEIGRALRAPLVGSWARSSLVAALRAEAVDFDLEVPGDSRSRLAATLNLRPRPSAALRLGWTYESRRDRFDNPIPSAALTVGIGSRF